MHFSFVASFLLINLWIHTILKTFDSGLAGDQHMGKRLYRNRSVMCTSYIYRASYNRTCVLHICGERKIRICMAVLMRCDAVDSSVHLKHDDRAMFNELQTVRLLSSRRILLKH